MASKAEITKTWSILSAAYPSYGKDHDPTVLQATLAIYQRLLADVPADVLAVAAEQHIATSRFFPTVAEIRGLCVSVLAPPASQGTALEAWGRVINAFTSGGPGGYYEYYDRIVWPDFSDDPILEAVVRDMGGMKAIRESENEVADRARFIQAYEARQRRQRDDILTLPQVQTMKQIQADRQQRQLTDGRNGHGPTIDELLERTADQMRH